MLPGGTALAVFEPPKTEFIGLAFAIIVLILAFGSVLAMGLPIAVALGGVGAGLGLIVILSNVIKIPDFTTFLGAMIGLGVGIDYALFIVTRYREGTPRRPFAPRGDDHRDGHRRPGRDLRRRHRRRVAPRSAPDRDRLGRRVGHRRRGHRAAPR